MSQFNVTHRSSTRLHTIMSITVERAQDISFTMTDRESGKDVKVYVPEYFKEYCGVEVTKPRLPCIQVSYVVPIIDSRKDELTGSTARRILSRSNSFILPIGTRFPRLSCPRTRLPSMSATGKSTSIVSQLTKQYDQGGCDQAQGAHDPDHGLEGGA